MRVRKTTEEDIPALGKLFSTVFGSPRDEQVWRWKYFDNPWGTHSWVAEDGDGNLIFHCGGTPVPFQDGQTRTIALQLTDFMKAPRQADGIGPGGSFARTTAAFFHDVIETGAATIFYGFPGERHRLAGEKLLDYRTAFPVFEATLIPGDSVVTARTRPLKPSDLSRFGSDGDGVQMTRSPELLRWRYLDRPSTYGVIAAGDTIAIVCELPSEVRLMELGGDVSSTGISRIVRSFSRLGRPVIGWFPPDHFIGRAMEQAGFEFRARDHYLAAAWVDRDSDGRSRRYFQQRRPIDGEFFYSLGDYDVW